MKIFEIKKFYDDGSVESIKSILGKYFSKLEKFFKKNFFDFEENISTILVTRRCFLLAIWFLGYLTTRSEVASSYKITEDGSCLCIKNPLTEKSNYIMSDRGISLLRTINAMGEIHILDDICIHGRQLDRIKNTVCKVSGLSREKIRKIVFMSSKESLVKIVEAEEETVKGEWILLSQRIVETINYLVLPYVSYLNSYITTDITLSEHEAFVRELYGREDLLVQKFGEKNKLLGKESFYIVEKSMIGQGLKNMSCIRYYYNIETNVASFIPYVVVAPLTGDLDEGRLRTILSEYLQDSATEKLIEIVNTITKYEYEKEKGFIYNLISCIASQYYGITFAKKYTKKTFDYISRWDSDICGCILIAFGTGIANIIKTKENFRSTDESTWKSICDPMKFQDFHIKVDDFTKQRWEQREIAAFERKIDPPKRTLFSLIDEEIEANSATLEDKPYNRSLIGYSFLCNVIDACDNGRQNIASQFDRADSYLEVGELGVMTVRANKDKATYELNQLLSIPYYYYILC